MDSRDLLSPAADGDDLAFEALVERHRDRVYGFALRLTGSKTAAAEIAQESFLSAYLHLSKFRDEAEFGAWVHWIAATHASLRQPPARALDAEATLNLPKFHEHDALAQHPTAEWSRGADERPLSPKLCQAIEHAVENLPQRHREVFLLKDVAGLTYQKIANVTGEPLPAIKGRIHEARLSLRETIDRFHSAS